MSKLYISLEVAVEGEADPEDLVVAVEAAITAMQIPDITVTSVDVEDWWW